MQHCDDDALALFALGERPSPADAAHLDGCAQCRAEVESFARTLAAGRGDRAPAAVVLPPAHVWDGIAAATGVLVRPRTNHDGGSDALSVITSAPATRSASATPSGLGTPSESPLSPPSLTVVPGATGPTSDDPVAAPRQLHPRPARTSRWPMLAVAASALVIGGIAGSLGTQLISREAPQPAPIVVAQAALDPLPVDPSASGRAVIVRSDGGRVLEVDVSKLARIDGFYEVWLIDASVKKMVPIGILAGSTGRFTIPEGLDLGQYPVVDISAEPLDGNPVHSGKSLLRGTIPG